MPFSGSIRYVRFRPRSVDRRGWSARLLVRGYVGEGFADTSVDALIYEGPQVGFESVRFLGGQCTFDGFPIGGCVRVGTDVKQL